MQIIFKIYRYLISPLFHTFSRMIGANPNLGCKFEPTCSCYCEQAVKKHGLIHGSLKGLWRVLRCHPFSQSRGYDPV